jgi:hypothetical protein
MQAVIGNSFRKCRPFARQSPEPDGIFKARTLECLGFYDEPLLEEADSSFEIRDRAAK